MASPVGRRTSTAPSLFIPVNTAEQPPQVQLASAIVEYTDKEIAQLLWLNPNTYIYEDMVQKVNMASIYLKKNGYTLKGVQADGNCFCNAFLGSYRTLSRKIPLLDSAGNQPSFLREQIAGIVEKKNINRAEEIKVDKNWITAAEEGELLAIALSIPIRVITFQKGEEDCGINDMLTFPKATKPSQTWETVAEEEKPEECILIVDLGRHFVYGELAENIKPGGISNTTNSPNIGGHNSVANSFGNLPQDSNSNLNLHRILNTIDVAAKMLEAFQKIFEPTDNTSSQATIEALQSVLFGHLAPDSLIDRSHEYIPSQVPRHPSVTQAVMTTFLELLVRIGMVKRPEHFQSESEKFLQASSPEDRQYKIAHKFFKDFVQNGLGYWLKVAREKIDSQDQNNSSQKAAAHKSFEIVEKFFKYMGSDKIYDPSESPLNHGVEAVDLQSLKTLSDWLNENEKKPEYDKYWQEFNFLSEKVRHQRETNLKNGIEYIFNLLKALTPEFQDVEDIEDMLAIMNEKHRLDSRKEFEEYYIRSFPTKDVFELNNLRQFWETLYSKQYGPTFYQIVCEALDPSNRESAFHQSILQLWYLSLVDTIHAYPKEARSRMPGLSFSGIPAPNFGYDMARSPNYAQWLNSNSIARASGDIIMDGFYWTVDWGASLNIGEFSDRVRKTMVISEKYSNKKLSYPNALEMPADVSEYYSKPHQYSPFIDPFAFFFLEKVYHKKFISDGNHNIFEELLKASKERGNCNPLEAFLEAAKCSLEEFKRFSENMKNLRSEGNDRIIANLGLVFGIGFNGNLFSSPPQQNGINRDEIWIAFAESGRTQPGVNLFLALLKNLVSCPSQQFCNDSLRSKEDYFFTYKDLILFHVNKEIQEHRKNLEGIPHPENAKYYQEKINSFSSLVCQLEQNKPFENLDAKHKEWITNAENWYRAPCKVNIATDEMSIAEKKAHESAREVFLHAAVQRSFTSDYPQLMPLLINHWKLELITKMREHNYSAYLIEKVNEGTLLTKVEESQVYKLIDPLIWEIHPVLKEVNQRLISQKLRQFINKKENSLNETKKSGERKIEKFKKNNPNTKEGIEKVKSCLEEAQNEVARIDEQLKMLQLPLSCWEREFFEEFKRTFFESREVGQCVEPIFAKVLGHDHFFPIYLSRSKPASCIPDAKSHSQHIVLQLGNIHSQYVIPPCDKNCQINALAHLYTSDLLREDQGADLLNTIRITQSLGEVPRRVYSLEELSDCHIS